MVLVAGVFFPLQIRFFFFFLGKKKVFAFIFQTKTKKKIKRREQKKTSKKFASAPTFFLLADWSPRLMQHYGLTSCKRECRRNFPRLSKRICRQRREQSKFCRTLPRSKKASIPATAIK